MSHTFLSSAVERYQRGDISGAVRASRRAIYLAKEELNQWEEYILENNTGDEFELGKEKLQSLSRKFLDILAICTRYFCHLAYDLVDQHFYDDAIALIEEGMETLVIPPVIASVLGNQFLSIIKPPKKFTKEKKLIAKSLFLPTASQSTGTSSTSESDAELQAFELRDSPCAFMLLCWAKIILKDYTMVDAAESTIRCRRNAQTHLFYAQIRHLQSDIPAAIHHYCESIALNPSFYPGIILLHSAYETVRHYVKEGGLAMDKRKVRIAYEYACQGLECDPLCIPLRVLHSVSAHMLCVSSEVEMGVLGPARHLRCSIEESLDESINSLRIALEEVVSFSEMNEIRKMVLKDKLEPWLLEKEEELLQFGEIILGSSIAGRRRKASRRRYSTSISDSDEIAGNDGSLSKIKEDGCLGGKGSFWDKMKEIETSKREVQKKHLKGGKGKKYKRKGKKKPSGVEEKKSEGSSRMPEKDKVDQLDKSVLFDDTIREIAADQDSKIDEGEDKDDEATNSTKIDIEKDEDASVDDEEQEGEEVKPIDFEGTADKEFYRILQSLNNTISNSYHPTVLSPRDISEPSASTPHPPSFFEAFDPFDEIALRMSLSLILCERAERLWDALRNRMEKERMLEDPRDPVCETNEARRVHEIEEAVILIMQDVNESLHLYPSLYAYKFKAKVYLDRGDVDRALKTYEKANEMRDDDLEVKQMIAKCHFIIAKAISSIRHAEMAYNLFPTVLSYALLYIDMNVQLKNYSHAISLLQKYLKACPDSYPIRQRLERLAPARKKVRTLKGSIRK
ncbi:hypothetical protein ADUPG1_011181 [Aduncisulcus paluster]|uniref:Uncharacterized protein n=1 Tax=Aduncisulcus paluster TaxID=2918883 RepID=A0ABQ5JZP5_9EUKA|nr:hypothetical protein ADUPG1_011181 [Aduncisulcus paluster]